MTQTLRLGLTDISCASDALIVRPINFGVTAIKNDTVQWLPAEIHYYEVVEQVLPLVVVPSLNGVMIPLDLLKGGPTNLHPSTGFDTLWMDEYPF
jgi:hypothetical protein